MRSRSEQIKMSISKFPWRGRVVHISSPTQPSKITFNDHDEESLFFSDDEFIMHYNNSDDETPTPKKSILKNSSKINGTGQAVVPKKVRSTNLLSFAYFEPTLKDITAVLKVIKKMRNQVPLIALQEYCNTLVTDCPNFMGGAHSVLAHMLEKKFVLETIHDGLKCVEAMLPKEWQRIKIAPLDFNEEIQQPQTIVGVVNNVLLDGSYVFSSLDHDAETVPLAIEPGKNFYGEIHGHLRLVICHSKLKSKCWRVFLPTEKQWAVLPEEKIRIRYVSDGDGKFYMARALGRKPNEGDKITAKVYLASAECLYTTVDEEAFFNFMMIKLPNDDFGPESEFMCRCVIDSGEYLLLARDLEGLISSYPNVLPEPTINFKRVRNGYHSSIDSLCRPLDNERQQILVKSFPDLADDKFIGTGDLATFLNFRIHDEVFIRELLLI